MLLKTGMLKAVLQKASDGYTSITKRRPRTKSRLEGQDHERYRMRKDWQTFHDILTSLHNWRNR